VIYLDNAATSYPKPEAVYRAIDDFARASGGNPGRAGHRLAVEAEAMIDDTRRLAARLFGGPRPERIVFCLNATDALNMAVKGVVRPGDHVITSVLEHNSINRPLNRLERDGVITLTRLPAGSDHLIDPDALARAWRPHTRLVAVTHASNVTGGLVVGERAEVAPWREGGTGGDSADPLQPADLPWHLEGGTPNVFGIAGLREGLRLLLERGVENVLAHERALLATLLGALRRPELFSFYGADRLILERGGEGRVGLLSFTMAGYAPDELATLLDQHFEIAVRPGLDCAPYAHQHLGTFPAGATRLSVGFMSTEDDVLEAAAALNELTGF
jgi:selenocysteine lyase/cysteine desulfurase